MQSLKNFLIAFGVGLVIFGIFAYFTIGLIDGNKQSKNNDITENIPDDETAITENIFASGNPENPETSESGNTFTAVVGGYDDSGKELDALIFIKADRENMRFVISSIPTNLKAVITGASGLPQDGQEIVDAKSVIYTDTPVRLKDFPAKFPEESESMIVDIVHLITGMPVNYYAFMGSENVKEIFKYTSGLYYDVPLDMVYIGNGTEEEPEISIKEGEQVLTAAQAIGLMRYASDTANERTNFNERAKRQSGFISSAMHQVLRRNPEEIVAGLSKILKGCNTNFTVETFKENFELISKFSEYSANNVTVTFDNYSSEILNYPDTQRRFVNYK